MLPLHCFSYCLSFLLRSTDAMLFCLIFFTCLRRQRASLRACRPIFAMPPRCARCSRLRVRTLMEEEVFPPQTLLQPPAFCHDTPRVVVTRQVAAVGALSARAPSRPRLFARVLRHAIICGGGARRLQRAARESAGVRRQQAQRCVYNALITEK